MSNDLSSLAWQPPTPAQPTVLGRPRRFEDVSGQEDADRDIQAFLEDALDPARQKPRCRTLLLSGVAGIGKTTIARILGNIALCWNPTEGHQACGTCAICKAFQENPPRGIDDYFEISAAEYSGVHAMSHLVALMRRAPLGRFKVGFADEAHRASRMGKDALLKDLEEPSPYAIYILATTEPDKLGAALLSRCHHVRLRPPSMTDRLHFLRRRCEVGWGLPPENYEPAALERLAVRVGANYRELAAALDRCITAGPLTTDTVDRLFPDPLAACLSSAEALLDDDLSGAISALVEAPGTPDEKRAAMQSLLLGLSLACVRGVVTPYDPLSDVPLERRQALVARFDARRPQSVSLATYLEDCARFWGASR
ncbi:AAA family ATPase [Methylobacterium sp. Leaf99]|uniref:AAA family ATPase n=1 Tax=Methylobacterium sp. Leaf99 TaxID=1736251 RepID=UPI0009E7D99B|nr:AAA family ATPase [Methylobacterium sp. Leaf99]